MHAQSFSRKQSNSRTISPGGLPKMLCCIKDSVIPGSAENAAFLQSQRSSQPAVALNLASKSEAGALNFQVESMAGALDCQGSCLWQRKQEFDSRGRSRGKNLVVPSSTKEELAKQLFWSLLPSQPSLEVLHGCQIHKCSFP